jgi:hypothetical protein
MNELREAADNLLNAFYKCERLGWHALKLSKILEKPEQEQKPLTDQEIIEAIKNISHNEMSAFNIARAVEKAHGIGNTNEQ